MKKLLIIDNILENIIQIKNCLNSGEFEFIESDDAFKVFELAKNENPDLIILGIMMQKLEGLELISLLSKDKKTEQIPIIILSADNNYENIKNGFEAGAVDFISMPFDCRELIARVKSALRSADNKKHSIELEKHNFAVKAYRLVNHKIKQPLTVIKLANTSIKRELDSGQIEIDSLYKRTQYIDNAINDINQILLDLEKMFKEDDSQI